MPPGAPASVWTPATRGGVCPHALELGPVQLSWELIYSRRKRSDTFWFTKAETSFRPVVAYAIFPPRGGLDEGALAGHLPTEWCLCSLTPSLALVPLVISTAGLFSDPDAAGHCWSKAGPHVKCRWPVRPETRWPGLRACTLAKAAAPAGSPT